MKKQFFIFFGVILFGYLIYIALAKHFPILATFLPVSLPFFGNSNQTTKKLILTWTPFFGKPMGDNYLTGCPFRNLCSITPLQRRYEEADAFVFHGLDMNLRHLPPRRTPNQIYVFLSHESPPNTDKKAYQIANFFNWTMTYRMDSDIPFPYSYMGKGQNPANPSPVNGTAILKGKRKDTIVAWFVSNCYTHSKREQYVTSLRTFIPVDVYGQCGSLICPRSQQTTCDGLLGEKYKFYIAFENSLCLDYVTEKYYARALLNSVPIVLKRSSVEKLFPRGSFVAASDFVHAKFLAAYLKYLDSNDTAYLEYFRWRTEGYQFQNHDDQGGYFGFCGLCQRLLKGSYENKSYADLKQWWHDGSQCDQDLVLKLISLQIP